MRRWLVLLVVAGLLAGFAQSLGGDPLGRDLPPGRPMPWAEITATLLTVSLLLWAAVLRREE